jgi:hypothetical protein
LFPYVLLKIILQAGTRDPDVYLASRDTRPRCLSCKQGHETQMFILQGGTRDPDVYLARRDTRPRCLSCKQGHETQMFILQAGTRNPDVYLARRDTRPRCLSCKQGRETQMFITDGIVGTPPTIPRCSGNIFTEPLSCNRRGLHRRTQRLCIDTSRTA